MSFLTAKCKAHFPDSLGIFWGHWTLVMILSCKSSFPWLAQSDFFWFIPLTSLVVPSWSAFQGPRLPFIHFILLRLFCGQLHSPLQLQTPPIYWGRFQPTPFSWVQATYWTALLDYLWISHMLLSKTNFTPHYCHLDLKLSSSWVLQLIEWNHHPNSHPSKIKTPASLLPFPHSTELAKLLTLV